MIQDRRVELQDEISEAITDSLDMDWSASDGARAVMRIPAIAEVPAMVQALRDLADFSFGDGIAMDIAKLRWAAKAILSRIDAA